jgi:hypothetical protein
MDEINMMIGVVKVSPSKVHVVTTQQNNSLQVRNAVVIAPLILKDCLNIGGAATGAELFPHKFPIHIRDCLSKQCPKLFDFTNPEKRKERGNKITASVQQNDSVGTVQRYALGINVDGARRIDNFDIFGVA